MRAAIVAVSANAALFAVKAIGAGVSDSLTILSETLNSLADVVSAVVVVICVRWAATDADADHPFGHRRAEPIAGLIVAIFTGILGFEVCRAAAMRLIAHQQPERIGWTPIVALFVAAAAKTLLSVYFSRRSRRLRSPALAAMAVDCRNDVFVSLQGLLAVALARAQTPYLDSVAALLVGAYILYGGHRIGMANIDYLMGRAPERAFLDDIRRAAAAAPHVHEVDDVLAHYVGTFVHVELTIRVEGMLTTRESHDIAEAVRDAVELLPVVDRAFIHVEPANVA